MSEEFRTDDMALATVLCLNGHEHSRLDRKGRRAFWVFPRGDGLADLVADYTAGEARCEPRDFMRKVGTIRDELYTFLDA